MRPPICMVCDRRSEPGAWLQFKDYQPLPLGIVGHPIGLEFACHRHLAAAQLLRHLTADEAQRSLRKQYRFARIWKDPLVGPFFGRKRRRWL